LFLPFVFALKLFKIQELNVVDEDVVKKESQPKLAQDFCLSLTLQVQLNFMLLRSFDHYQYVF